MSNYPPPGGYDQGYGQGQGQGYNQGYNQGYGQGQGQGYNQGSGYGPQGGGQGYDQWQPQQGGQGSFGSASSGYGASNVYPQQGGGFNSGSAPPGYPGQHQDQGSFNQQGGPDQWNASNVPLEHLPPGYNPATRAPYQPHELPAGAQAAGPGEEGYIPAGMSRDEAQSRGFIGTAGGGLLGMWLGHKFGKKHHHGFLGTLGGAGAGAFIGNKLF